MIKSNEYYLHIYIICTINIILASSLRTIASTGQMSIGQAGFMAIGAYASAILTVKFHVPVWSHGPGGTIRDGGSRVDRVPPF